MLSNTHNTYVNGSIAHLKIIFFKILNHDIHMYSEVAIQCFSVSLPGLLMPSFNVL